MAVRARVRLDRCEAGRAGNIGRWDRSIGLVLMKNKASRFDSTTIFRALFRCAPESSSHQPQTLTISCQYRKWRIATGLRPRGKVTLVDLPHSWPLASNLLSCRTGSATAADGYPNMVPGLQSYLD